MHRVSAWSAARNSTWWNGSGTAKDKHAANSKLPHLVPIPIALLAAAPASRGQTERARLSGTVKDSSDAVVQGARIAVTNTATGVKGRTALVVGGDGFARLPGDSAEQFAETYVCGSGLVGEELPNGFSPRWPNLGSAPPSSAGLGCGPQAPPAPPAAAVDPELEAQVRAEILARRA